MSPREPTATGFLIDRPTLRGRTTTPRKGVSITRIEIRLPNPGQRLWDTAMSSFACVRRRVLRAHFPRPRGAARRRTMGAPMAAPQLPRSGPLWSPRDARCVARPGMQWDRTRDTQVGKFSRFLIPRFPCTVGGGRKLHRYGGRNLHAPTSWRLRDSSGSRRCTGGSNECCYVTTWSGA